MVTHGQYTPEDHPLIRKLQSVFSLSTDEQRALVNLPMQVTKIRGDQNIVKETVPPDVA